MSKGRTRQFLVTRWHHGSSRRQPDRLVVEEPLSIRLDDTLVATTMRTPGHDFELAVGFCHSEGLIDDGTVTGIRYCATGSATDTGFNVVTVDTRGAAPAPTPRLTTMSSSCGLCGTEAIDELMDRLAPVPPTHEFSATLLAGIGDRVRPHQEVFDVTGGLHAAAAFTDDGEIVVVREDIGRHNAVDKVVGRLLLDHRLPVNGWGLFVSGRASFEMVYKAWAAGMSAVVAVSAPSALAVDTAAAAGIQLAGFVRDGAVNIYS